MGATLREHAFVPRRPHSRDEVSLRVLRLMLATSPEARWVQASPAADRLSYCDPADRSGSAPPLTAGRSAQTVFGVVA